MFPFCNSMTICVYTVASCEPAGGQLLASLLRQVKNYLLACCCEYEARFLRRCDGSVAPLVAWRWKLPWNRLEILRCCLQQASKLASCVEFQLEFFSTSSAAFGGAIRGISVSMAIKDEGLYKVCHAPKSTGATKDHFYTPQENLDLLVVGKCHSFVSLSLVHLPWFVL